MDFDVKKITQENLKDANFTANLEKYCKLDVVVMQEVYYKFITTLQAIIPGLK